jgi:DNA-binding transcriptional MerR regulator
VLEVEAEPVTIPRASTEATEVGEFAHPRLRSRLVSGNHRTIVPHSPPETGDPPTYRIGAVSRLTQIPAETLRVWERRYDVVEPRRGGGQTRLYTREDVERLTRIKQLVDRGHAISTVASLSLDELEERLREHHARGAAALRPEGSPEALRAVFIGETVAPLARSGSADLDGVEIAGAVDAPEDADDALLSANPHVIVLECPTVDARTARTAQSLLRRSRAVRVLVVYGFGTRESVQRLSAGRVRAIRGPLSAFELKRAILESEDPDPYEVLRTADVAGDVPTDAPARRFSTAALAKISGVSSTVQCECPQHLVALVTQLSAFEAYSAECENKNDKDAALHAMLHRTTAHVRARMEDALAQVMEAEGIVL